MILSSINFIRANTKPKLETDRQFTDFIIDKIKEEQDRRDASIGVTNCPCPQKLEQNVKGTTSCNRGIPKEADTTVSYFLMYEYCKKIFKVMLYNNFLMYTVFSKFPLFNIVI